MKTFAIKNSINEPVAAHHRAAKHVPVSRGSSAFPGSVPYIQLKPICACDGGCPRCTGVIQPKLTIGAPNEKYEQEADRVADQVMRMPEPEGSLINGHSSSIQLQSACPECPEKEEIQTKPLADQITPLVQRQFEPEEKEETVYTKQINSQRPVVTSSIESGIQSLKSGGQPLPESTRSYFEPRFGTDFSQVRVHTDSRAAETARSVNARAFTTGKDMVFGAGQYAPETSSGNTLLAHELTHVVQQQDVAAAEDTAKTPSSAHLSPRIARLISTAPMGAVQRQLVTPLAQGGGFRGLLDRDRRSVMPQASSGGETPSPSMRRMSRIKVWFNAFIPYARVNGPPFYDCFTGDGRSFSNAIHASSRTHQEIEFDVTTLRKTIDWKAIGTSHRVDCTTGAVLETATAPVSQLTNGSVIRSGRDILVDFREAASNPLVAFAPAIDADVVFHIDPISRNCRLTGSHDGFPAYEAYVTTDGGAGVPVYTYDPITAGENISALFPPMDKTARGAARF